MRIALRACERHCLTSINSFRQAKWLKNETKWLMSNLSMARDWDVLLCDLLAPVETARPGEVGLAGLRLMADTAREKGYLRVRNAIRSRRYSRLLARMREWLSAKVWRGMLDRERGRLEESTAKLARRLLAKRHRAVLKLGRGFKKLSTEKRHQVRIILKKFGYTAEFFRALYEGKREKVYFHSLAQSRRAWAA